MRLIALLTALVLSLSVAVATASAATQYEGTVTAINKDKRTFRLNDSERGTIRIKVTRNTRFERINGFGALRVGHEPRRGNREARPTAAGWPSRSSARAAAAATAVMTTKSRLKDD